MQPAKQSSDVLVLGGSGRVGRSTIHALLRRGIPVRTIVRSKSSLPEAIQSNPKLTTIEASITQLSTEELTEHMRGCTTAVSCLGHNMTFAGLFGPPRFLVRDSASAVCRILAASQEARPARFILLSSDGVDHPDGSDGQSRSFCERTVLGALEALVPPHRDNVEAAKAVQSLAARNARKLEWVGVRPVSFNDEVNDHVHDYDLLQKPAGAFGSARVAIPRIAEAIADIVSDEKVWQQWQGRMPVVKDKEECETKHT